MVSLRVLLEHLAMIQFWNIQTFSNFQIKEFEKVLFIEHKSFTQPSFIIHQGAAHSSGESPQYILMIKLTVVVSSSAFLKIRMPGEGFHG